MPPISVIVPIHDVEPYLEECLRSVQAQTLTDLEVVMVDDGSKDRSAAIAAAFAAEDPRFRLIRQPNGGLGRARNVGVEASHGEYLAFLDSDDTLPPDAYARLRYSLERSGSDFATGNIHRFNSLGARPAQFLAKAFWCGRRRTHVTRFRWLLCDRMAQNKLWRRSFWEDHELRFPEGVYHEDIPVVLPAHFLARSVDVLRAPVYLYREREVGVRSITQRRTDRRVLRDRADAVERVSDFLERRGQDGAARWYAERVLSEDLLYHLDVYHAGDAAYRRAFMRRANRFLDRVDPGVLERLPAIQRLKWHLVRRGLRGELLEVLRFQREQFAANPRRFIRGRAYGDYPFLDDPDVQVPRDVYRLDTTRRRIRHAGSMLGVGVGVARRPAPDRPAPDRPATGDALPQVGA